MNFAIAASRGYFPEFRLGKNLVSTTLKFGLILADMKLIMVYFLQANNLFVNRREQELRRT